MSNRRLKERQASRTVSARNQRTAYIVIGVVAVLVVAGIIYLISQQKPAIPELASATSSPALTEEALPTQEGLHIERGTPHEAYNSDPPTSGPHYSDTMIPVPAGFYEDFNKPLDEELVHAEEHGYVIVWFDCAKAPDGDCDAFKAALKKFRDQLTGFKLIVLPRSNMPTMLVMTSWGKLQRFDAFDVDAMTAFYRRNLSQSPEPDGP